MVELNRPYVLRAQLLVVGTFDPAAYGDDMPFPTGSSWRRGDVRRRDRATGEEHAYDQDGWESSWLTWDGIAIADLVEHFVERVEGARPAYKDLARQEGVSTELSIVLKLHATFRHQAETPSMSLDASLLARLGRCGLDVDVDLYAVTI